MLKKIIVPGIFIAAFLSSRVNAQDSDEAISLLQKLDSVRNSSSISRYFADIYFETTVNAVSYFSTADVKVQGLMDRMEKRFAGYFFRSVNAHENNLPVPREWKAYYKEKNAPPLRYILFGINAHINGDIWQALTTEFTVEELEEIKAPYFLYYDELLKEYSRVYESAIVSNPKIRLLHTVSFGFDKAYGKLLLTRWRKRQVQLAELYFTNKPQFEKELKKLQQKMDRLDNLIRNHT